VARRRLSLNITLNPSLRTIPATVHQVHVLLISESYRNCKDASGAPPCEAFQGGAIWINRGPNDKIDVNDFNCVIDYNGAISLEYPSGSQSDNNNRISYNSFEHCDYRGVEIVDGTNNQINHNNYLDCSDAAEVRWAQVQPTWQGTYGIARLCGLSMV
jgi:hypothetical protein